MSRAYCSWNFLDHEFHQTQLLLTRQLAFALNYLVCNRVSHTFNLPRLKNVFHLNQTCYFALYFRYYSNTFLPFLTIVVSFFLVYKFQCIKNVIRLRCRDKCNIRERKQHTFSVPCTIKNSTPVPSLIVRTIRTCRFSHH